MTELGLPAFLSNQVGTQLGARACVYAGVYALPYPICSLQLYAIVMISLRLVARCLCII
jgi:hypothetical protein